MVTPSQARAGAIAAVSVLSLAGCTSATTLGVSPTDILSAVIASIPSSTTTTSSGGRTIPSSSGSRRRIPESPPPSSAASRVLRTADAYVLSLGVEAPLVARSLGIRLAVYPAKGYSSTFPLKPGGLTPSVPGVDEQWLVGWSRLGDRLRLTSTAEFAGYDRTWTPRDFGNIMRFARDIFPDAADWERGEYRACLRPMTPDGRPVIGRGRYENLVYNAGHGHMGWTMACGTARIVSDLIAGRRSEIDISGFAPRTSAGGL